MAFPTAAGVPSHSGVMIPEIWSGKLLVKFYQRTIMSEIANTDYEGEIKAHGDKVNIRTTPDITIRKFSKGQPLQTERPIPKKVELKIDQGDYWNFVVDSVDKAQADYNFVENWTDDAAKQQKIFMEREIFSTMYTKADPANRGANAGKLTGNVALGATGSAFQLTKANIVDQLVFAGQVLDEQDVPEDGRWAILPAWACARLKVAPENADASATGDAKSPVKNGRWGQIDRFTIYMSNLLSSVVDGGNRCFHAMFGHKSALTFASQFVENDTLKAESTFGHLVRGLHVYGWEVIKPEALGHFYIRP